MRQRCTSRWMLPAAAAVTVALLGACGSDDDSGAGVAPSDTGTSIGALTVTADPGQAWANVGDTRVDYLAAESINHRCTIGDTQIDVNFQTSGGVDLAVAGVLQNGQWTIEMTFTLPDEDDVEYRALSTTNVGAFGVETGQLSYEGSVDRITGGDEEGSVESIASAAVNCTAG